MSSAVPTEPTPQGAGWLTQLWVSGLALLMVAAAVKVVFDTNPPDARMPLYLVLGTVVPLCVLALGTGHGAARARRVAEVALAASGAAVSLLLLVDYSSIWALALAFSQWITTVLLLRVSGEAPRSDGIRDWLIALYVAVVCWTVAIQLLGNGIFWQFSFVDSSAFLAWTAVAWSSVPVLCASFVLVLSCLALSTRLAAARIASPAGVINVAAHGAALAVFVALSLRSDQWGGPYFADAHWHWSYFVGPAQDVREGGWLLWDVPSWYGFGNILLLALLPTSSTWHSMYLVNATSLLLSAALLYVVLRALRPGWLGWLFSVTATIACVFLLPGRANDITGPQIWPSAAAFRFVWVYVLLAILWWGHRRAMRQGATRHVPILSSLAWTAGVLWSFESAVYVTAVWLPALTLLAWHDAGAAARPVLQRLGAVFMRLLVPLSLLGAAGVAVAAFYWLAAGRLPDVSGYYEVAWAFRAFRDKFYTGSVGLWLLLLVFCAASTVVVSLVRGQSAWTMALAAAAWAMLWSTSSSIVLKGDAMTLLSGAPHFMISLGLLLHLADRHLPPTRLASAPHVTFAAVSIVLLTLAYGNLPKLTAAAARFQFGYAGVASNLPVLDEARLALVQTAGLGPRDRLIVLDAPGILDVPQRAPALQSWLPMRSWERMVNAGTVVLPPARMQRYVSRAVERVALGGCVLVSRTTRTSPAWAWFFDELGRSHTEEIAGETADHLLLRYRYRGTASPAAGGPAPASLAPGMVDQAQAAPRAVRQAAGAEGVSSRHVQFNPVAQQEE